jgi:hypothetical protein
MWTGRGPRAPALLKGGTITLTPEPVGDAQAYVARAEFMPLVLLSKMQQRPPRLSWEAVVCLVVQVGLRGGDSFDVPRGFLDDSRRAGGMRFGPEFACRSRRRGRNHCAGERRSRRGRGDHAACAGRDAHSSRFATRPISASLRCFLDDGWLPAHNNISELNLRRQVLGRRTGSRLQRRRRRDLGFESSKREPMNGERTHEI